MAETPSAPADLVASSEVIRESNFSSRSAQRNSSGKLYRLIEVVKTVGNSTVPRRESCVIEVTEELIIQNSIILFPKHYSLDQSQILEVLGLRIPF